MTRLADRLRSLIVDVDEADLELTGLDELRDTALSRSGAPGAPTAISGAEPGESDQPDRRAFLAGFGGLGLLLSRRGRGESLKGTSDPELRNSIEVFRKLIERLERTRSVQDVASLRLALLRTAVSLALAFNLDFGTTSGDSHEVFGAAEFGSELWRTLYAEQACRFAELVQAGAPLPDGFAATQPMLPLKLAELADRGVPLTPGNYWDTTKGAPQSLVIGHMIIGGKIGPPVSVQWSSSSVMDIVHCKLSNPDKLDYREVPRKLAIGGEKPRINGTELQHPDRFISVRFSARHPFTGSYGSLHELFDREPDLPRT